MRAAVLLALFLCVSPTLGASYETNFKLSGWPTIVFLFGGALIAYAIWVGYHTRSDTSSLSTRAFLGLNLWNCLTAIFFAFAPGGNPNGASLSVLLVFLVAVGFYVGLTANHRVTHLFAVLALIDLLALLGLLPFFGLPGSVAEFNTAHCGAYYGQLSVDRCDQYLDLLRTSGLLTVFAIAAQLTIVFPTLDWTIGAGAGGRKPGDGYATMQTDQSAHGLVASAEPPSGLAAAPSGRAGQAGGDMGASLMQGSFQSDPHERV